MIFHPQQSNHSNTMHQLHWPTESIAIADRLLDHIPDISNQLFADGDLTGYLNLMCQMPYYHFLNLLLIYEKCPTAVCLASQKIWRSLLPSDTSNVIKPEQVQNSISLLTPFINNLENKLLWYSIKVYDISQTYVKSLVPTNKVYIQDLQHLDLLIESVGDTLSNHYDIRVLVKANSSVCRLTFFDRSVSSKTIDLDHITDELKLYWLTENLCEQFIQKKQLMLDSSGLLIQTLCTCLFKIWGITHHSLPTIPKGSYCVIAPQEQYAFLNILQHSLYEINQQISSAYLNARNEADIVTVNFDLN